MGRLRSAAKHVAHFTERHMPMPARRWASALTHELDHVEGEWHSLAWALGGLRLLVRHGFVPTPTPALVERQAALHARLRRHTAQRSPANRLLNRAQMLFSSLFFLYVLHRFYPACSFSTAGLVLYCAGSLTLLLSGLRQPAVALPAEEDTPAVLALYQADLRRSTRWGAVAGSVLPALSLFAGTELLAPTSWVRVLGFVWVAMVLLRLQKYRANLVTLDALAGGLEPPPCA